MRYIKFICLGFLIQTVLITASFSAPGDILFEEDFESQSFFTNKWKRNDSYHIGISDVTQNDGSYSAFVRNKDVILRSKRINLSAVPAAELTLWLQHGFNRWDFWLANFISEAPGTNDFLYIELLYSGRWNTHKVYVGEGLAGAGKVYNVRIPIPAAALNNRFRFRFKTATTGYTGSFAHLDYWHIDSIQIKELAVNKDCGNFNVPGYKVVFCDDFEWYNLSGNWEKYDNNGNINSAYTGAHITNDTASTVNGHSLNIWSDRRNISYSVDLKPMDLRPHQNKELKVQYWWRRGADYIHRSGFPDLGYDLVFKYQVNGGSWVEVKRFPGGVNPGEQGVYEYIIPESLKQENVVFSFTLQSNSGSGDGGLNEYHIDDFLILEKEGNQLHHFQWRYNNAVTCEPAAIELKACANADCSELYQDDVEVTLSPASSWQNGQTQTITNGVINLSLAKVTAGTYSLAVSSSSVAKDDPNENDLCAIGGNAPSTSCDIIFADAGLIFDIPDFIANEALNNVPLRAVKKADNSNACIPLLANQTKAIQFNAAYSNPNTGTKSFLINDIAITTASNPATYTSINLNFDVNGVALFKANYLDAGLLNINAKLEDNIYGENLVLEGNDGVRTRPAGFCITSPAPNAYCISEDASCSVYKKAGEEFPLTITAVAWQSTPDNDLCVGNITTPNFKDVNIALTHQLIAPSGGNTGTFTPVNYNHTAGETSISNAKISEVGVFKIATNPVNYFGKTIPASTSQSLGRFVPASFQVAIDDHGQLTPFCNSFSYIGQDLGWSSKPLVNIKALNMQGAITQNYTMGAFKKLTLGDITRTLTLSNLGVDGQPLTLTESTPLTHTLATLATKPGELFYTYNNQFSVTKNANALVAPFNLDASLELNLIQDSDSVTQSGQSLVIKPTGTLEMRYGRIFIEDAYGPENINLIMPLTTQYFTGSAFVINTEDSCTTYNTDPAASLVTATSANPAITAQGESGTFSTGTTGSNKGVVLTAPGASCNAPLQCKADVSYQAPVWLQDFFGGSVLTNPTGTGIFGVYRGNDKIIYWRELLQ